MNTLPLITLGIPIYNAAGLIERTLLSALNQTYPNIEFIFVDDKGDSMDIVRRVAGGTSTRKCCPYYRPSGQSGYGGGT